MSRRPLAAANFMKPPENADTARIFAPWAGLAPAFRTSAAACPSGKLICCSTTRERRSGTEKRSPKSPPRPAIASTHQKSNSCQTPRNMSAGSVQKITPEAMEQPADAPVATMLFSRMPPPPRTRSTAIETTAAGIAEAMVTPAKSPQIHVGGSEDYRERNGENDGASGQLRCRAALCLHDFPLRPRSAGQYVAQCAPRPEPSEIAGQ